MQTEISLLSLVDGRRTDMDVEFPVGVANIGFDFREIGDDETYEVSGHQHGRGEVVPVVIIHSISTRKYIRNVADKAVKDEECGSTCIAVVLINGMLDKAVMSRWRPKVTVNVDFMLGSSKQGKALLASVGSIWDTAMYLSPSETHNIYNVLNIIRYMYLDEHKWNVPVESVISTEQKLYLSTPSSV